MAGHRSPLEPILNPLQTPDSGELRGSAVGSSTDDSDGSDGSADAPIPPRGRGRPRPLGAVGDEGEFSAENAGDAEFR